MIEAFSEIIKSLPDVAKNWKALLFLSLTGLIVGFAGFPLWILFRNEDEVIQFLRTFSSKEIEPYPREQLILVRDKLKDLISDTGANRAIFGIIKDSNRIVLVEAYAPYEEPLPLGFQSVYIDSDDYSVIFNTLRLDSCLYLDKVSQSSYFRKELDLSNANYYLVCPSNSNWFVSLYTEEKKDTDLIYLQNTITELEDLLNFDIGTS